MWTLYYLDKMFSTYTYSEFKSLPEAVDLRNEILAECGSTADVYIIAGSCSMTFIETIEKAGYKRAA